MLTIPCWIEAAGSVQVKTYLPDLTYHQLPIKNVRYTTTKFEVEKGMCICGRSQLP